MRSFWRSQSHELPKNSGLWHHAGTGIDALEATGDVDEFAKALPGRKVARFYQIENKMDAVIRYNLAATIPVVEEERGVPAK